MTRKQTIKEGFSTLIDYGAISDKNLTDAEFRIFTFMKLRWQFFKHNKKDYYESIPTIAEHTNKDKKTVERAVQKFKKFGYMQVYKSKGKPNRYVVLDRDGVPF